MASSRASSSKPDWKDVARTMDYLEEVWGMGVQVTIRNSGSPSQTELQLEGSLMTWDADRGGQVPWVSANRSIRTGDAGGFEAVLLVLLYRLDGVAEQKKEGDHLKTA